MLNATWYVLEAQADTDLNYDDYRDGYRLREVLYYSIEKNIETFKVPIQGLAWSMK
jgi:hypothetical protein